MSDTDRPNHVLFVILMTFVILMGSLSVALYCKAKASTHTHRSHK